jgi:hypothetical protein
MDKGEVSVKIYMPTHEESRIVMIPSNMPFYDPSNSPRDIPFHTAMNKEGERVKEITGSLFSITEAIP